MIKNKFIYDIIDQTGMPIPDIAVNLLPSYSQCYEDIIVESILRAYSRNFGGSFVIIEIGANHPVSTSSSFLFKQKYGLKTILVEANPNLIPALEKYRSDDVIIAAAVVDNDVEHVNFYISQNNETSSLDNKFVEIRTPGVRETIQVPTIRVNSVLEKAITYGQHLILSIDVEAYDLPILMDIDYLRFRPMVIIIEPSEDYKPGSIKSIIDFMKSKNYSLIAETNVNLIFKDNEKI